MRRWPIACVGAMFTAATVLICAPAQADPPSCDNGPVVEPDCPAGSVCTAVIDGRCVGVQPPLLPPPPDVRVGIEGGIGGGI